MKKQKPTAVSAPEWGSPFAIATMGMELAFYSWETIARRSLLMISGACPPAEYQRMVLEKAAAFSSAAIAVGSGRPDAFARTITPLHAAVKANVRRLRG
jgi:hypothetical protein